MAMNPPSRPYPRSYRSAQNCLLSCATLPSITQYLTQNPNILSDSPTANQLTTTCYTRNPTFAIWPLSVPAKLCQAINEYLLARVICLYKSVLVRSSWSSAQLPSFRLRSAPLLSLAFFPTSSRTRTTCSYHLVVFSEIWHTLDRLD